MLMFCVASVWLAGVNVNAAAFRPLVENPLKLGDHLRLRKLGGQNLKRISEVSRTFSGTVQPSPYVAMY